MSDFTTTITYRFDTYAQFFVFLSSQEYGCKFTAEIADVDPSYIGNLRISSMITSVKKGRSVVATVLAGSSAKHDAESDLWSMTLIIEITRVESAPPHLRLVK